MRTTLKGSIIFAIVGGLTVLITVSILSLYPLESAKQQETGLLKDSVEILKNEINIREGQVSLYEEKQDSIREHNAGLYVDYVNTLSVIKQMVKEKKISKEIAKKMEEIAYQDHVRKLTGGEKDKEITLQELNLIRPNY